MSVSYPKDMRERRKADNRPGLITLDWEDGEAGITLQGPASARVLAYIKRATQHTLRLMKEEQEGKG